MSRDMAEETAGETVHEVYVGAVGVYSEVNGVMGR